MRLQELTPAETAFLTAPAAAPDNLQARLSHKLAATLSARLRLPVQAMPMPYMVQAQADVAPVFPVWQPDAALASLWLTRRLGGQRVMGATSFVPHTLIHTLDAALAECWLDAAAQATLPAVLAWHITAAHTQATLAVRLPQHTTDMTRWARGVIRHG
jgi:hypothetical protein